MSRAAALALGFAAALFAAGAAIWAAIERADLGDADVGVSAGLHAEQRFARIAEQPREPQRVLYLADSLAGLQAFGDVSLPSRLQDRLAQHPPFAEARVRRLVTPAMGAWSHYFLSDLSAGTRPDLVVLSVNLRWFGDPWLWGGRTALVGWLPVGRWPEAFGLPLHVGGVSADLVAFMRLLVTTRAVEPWAALRVRQAQLAAAWWDLAEALQQRAGQPEGLRFRVDRRVRGLGRQARRDRATEAAARRAFDALLAGVRPSDPTLQVIDALLRRFRREGASCLVYAAPANVAHLRALGVYDADGVARSLASLAAVAEGRGCAFRDLHALLPDAGFRDADDHLSPAVPPDAPGRVVGALLPAVVDALGARAARDARRG